MSMNSSFCYGYGFPCDYTDRALFDFIANHKTSFIQSDEEKELYDQMIYMDDFSDIEEIFEDYSCKNNGVAGTGAVVANIMSRETGIHFAYCQEDDECETKASILLMEGLPWDFSEAEKKLTLESLEELCLKYRKELRIPEPSDYLALEYFG